MGSDQVAEVKAQHDAQEQGTADDQNGFPAISLFILGSGQTHGISSFREVIYQYTAVTKKREALGLLPGFQLDKQLLDILGLVQMEELPPSAAVQGHQMGAVKGQYLF